MNSTDDVEQTAQEGVEKWKRRTIALGIALAIRVALVAPFLDGYPLHRYFQTFGKYLIYVSTCLLSLFVGSAALTYNFWWYWRRIRAAHKGRQHSTN